MIFHRLSIDGLYLIELEPHVDDRGFFARTFCEEEFSAQGLNTLWPQCNLSHSNRRGTLRGIHFQMPPRPDAKLVRVGSGAIFTVVADLRDGSGFGQRLCSTLSAEDGAMLYIPAGCAFGFQTLKDGTEIDYQISVAYRSDLSAGVRWDDPDLAVSWPLEVSAISDRDAHLPLLRDIAAVSA